MPKPCRGSCCRAMVNRRAAAIEVARLHLLAPQRRATGNSLDHAAAAGTSARPCHVRALFFSHGQPHRHPDLRLRCQAVAGGAGSPTDHEVLDSTLLAWKKSLALGRAPHFANGDRTDQDTLTLQFTVKVGLPDTQVLDGSSRRSAYEAPDARADVPTAIRFGSAWRRTESRPPRLADHRPTPEGAHVTCARLVRRRVADRTMEHPVASAMLRRADPLPTPALGRSRRSIRLDTMRRRPPRRHRRARCEPGRYDDRPAGVRRG